MIIFIYGEDTFRSRQFLKKSIEEFRTKRDPQGFNTVIFDALSDDSQKIIGEIMTLPFLAEKRMIVLQNLLSSKDLDFVSRLIKLIEEKRIPEVNVVVIWQASAVGRSSDVKKLEELLKKEKYSYEFSTISENELPSWIIKEVENRGGLIAKAAAISLARASGKDIWLVSSLIDQLIAFRNGAEISLDDLSKFLDEKIDDNIFSMVDAITAGNKKLAFNLLSGQRSIGQDEGYLFAMILRQFKILLEMRDLWEREEGLTSNEIAKKIGVHPFVAKKSLPLVRRFNMDELKKIYDDLLEIDRRVKTGIASQDVLIDLFVGKM